MTVLSVDWYRNRCVHFTICASLTAFEQQRIIWNTPPNRQSLYLVQDKRMHQHVEGRIRHGMC
jgi:hypothetical protein